jgi:hypothetical protein
MKNVSEKVGEANFNVVDSGDSIVNYIENKAKEKNIPHVSFLTPKEERFQFYKSRYEEAIRILDEDKYISKSKLKGLLRDVTVYAEKLENKIEIKKSSRKK